MFLGFLKNEVNMTTTENGAATYRSTQSDCLDLFATIGALRTADAADVVQRFIKAYAEDADLAMKTLFFARDVRGGLGERRVFRTILAYLAASEPESVRRNLAYIAEYGRYDDLLALLGTPCEADMFALVKAQLARDVEALAASRQQASQAPATSTATAQQATACNADASLQATACTASAQQVTASNADASASDIAAARQATASGTAPVCNADASLQATATQPASVSLLAKWLPSVNASNREAAANARKIARALGMTDAQYRKTLSALRAHIKIIENNLREKDFTFDYTKQPSKALYKYRQAFLRSDAERYQAFLAKAESDPTVLHAGTLTPYDVIAPVITRIENREAFSEAERHSMDVTWKSLEDFAGAENALAVVDGSGSMYWGGQGYMPAAVAQSLGIYFAEHNRGAFRGHFITFSRNPQLVEVKGRDIVEKVRYCMSFNECANTDLAKTFELLLKVAVRNNLRQQDMPSKLYVISDMEFDMCAQGAEITNFEHAKAEYARFGYQLPQIVFWNVASRNRQQPVTQNEQGVALVSGVTPRIFSMIAGGIANPRAFMMEVLGSERYAKIAA